MFRKIRKQTPKCGFGNVISSLFYLLEFFFIYFTQNDFFLNIITYIQNYLKV